MKWPYKVFSSHVSKDHALQYKFDIPNVTNKEKLARQSLTLPLPRWPRLPEDSAQAAATEKGSSLRSGSGLLVPRCADSPTDVPGSQNENILSGKAGTDADL